MRDIIRLARRTSMLSVQMERNVEKKNGYAEELAFLEKQHLKHQ